MQPFLFIYFFFFFNDPATTEIYPLPLHDALPIYNARGPVADPLPQLRDISRRPHEGQRHQVDARRQNRIPDRPRSEEHTSELQSRLHLVCRLLLEKKKKQCSAHKQPPDDDNLAKY